MSSVVGRSLRRALQVKPGVSGAIAMVEFRNTRPPPSLAERSEQDLLEDLCIALREVAVHQPSPERPQAVLAIAAEIDRRGVSIAERLDQLSQETGWLMRRLLVDCRDHLSAYPQVRELDGIRRFHRCLYCKAGEHPDDDVQWGACDACLRRLITSLDTLATIQGTVLFRSYSPEWRCVHAGAETVLLGALSWEDGLGVGACKRCLEETLAQREANQHAR